MEEKMNERIRELAQQAGYEKDMFGIGHWDMPECKKFAELIVRECAGICFSEAEGHNMAFGEHCGIIIKEHFGVDE
jgi:hypothetical protein